MYAGDNIHNPAGAKLTFQSDGNLVEYRADGHVCWASNTNGKGGVRVTYQNDGNFVMYASTDDSRPVWVGYYQLTGACE
ncbi:hypothetical protein ABIA35_000504 [Catenulispora sp. MAP12-49]|uniref:hypothetical protein n=1 Tax=unclassified Catenulispora TaxID=414885 RepID=UPI003510E2F4